MTHSTDPGASSLPGATGRRPVLAYLAGSALWASGAAQAQGSDNYPNRPIKFIVSFAPGSATDTVARVFGQRVAAILGQSVVVENRPGAVGIIGADAVAKAAPDGYTLLVGTNTTNAAVRALVKTVPYDPEKDFTPISFLGVLPQVLLVSPERPFKTLPELLARAREKPNTLTYSWTSSVTRVSAELLASMSRVSFVNVPYKTGGAALTDLISGQVDFTIVDTIVALPQIKAGKLRALAVASPARIAQLPDVPTVAEAANLPGYEMMGIFAAFGPANLPAPIVARLNQAIRQAGEDPELRRTFAPMGLDVQTSTPEQLRTRFQQEAAKWTRTAAGAGIVPE
jgi:tripartite-type tricarboxylate transporter receptor subunit TctC